MLELKEQGNRRDAHNLTLALNHMHTDTLSDLTQCTITTFENDTKCYRLSLSRNRNQYVV